jgi:hypothetical protein
VNVGFGRKFSRPTERRYKQEKGECSAEHLIIMPIKPAPSAAPWIPEHLTPPLLQAASKNCEGCDLFRYATQTVFGEGPPNAAVVMVGEQTWRSGRPRGKTVRRASRQALQVCRERQAAHSRETERHRDLGVPSVAGGGACGDSGRR